MGVDFAALHDFFGEERFLVVGLVADAFGDGDHAAAEFGVDAIDVGEELVLGEIDFGDVDQMRAVGLVIAAEDGGGGEPAGVAAHDDVDLDALERAVVVIVALMGEGDEPAGRAVAGGVVVVRRSLSMVLGTW